MMNFELEPVSQSTVRRKTLSFSWRKVAHFQKCVGSCTFEASETTTGSGCVCCGCMASFIIAPIRRH